MYEILYYKKTLLTLVTLFLTLFTELVPHFKYIGIIFDSKLNFSPHTEIINNKAFRNFEFI